MGLCGKSGDWGLGVSSWGMFAGLCCLALACSRADYRHTNLVCGESKACPTGYSCCPDHYCKTDCSADDGKPDAAEEEDGFDNAEEDGGLDDAEEEDGSDISESTDEDGGSDISENAAEMVCNPDSLCWQLQADFVPMTWVQAESYCASLTWGKMGRFSFTDWRLPTLDELRSLVDGCSYSETGGNCGVSEACSLCVTPTCWSRDYCDGCGDGLGPGPNHCYWQDDFGADCGLWYWSATKCSDDNSQVWYIDFQAGGMYHEWHAEVEKVTVRCVRP